MLDVGSSDINAGDTKSILSQSMVDPLNKSRMSMALTA